MPLTYDITTSASESLNLIQGLENFQGQKLTASLDSLSQCLAVLMVKKFYPYIHSDIDLQQQICPSWPVLWNPSIVKGKGYEWIFFSQITGQNIFYWLGPQDLGSNYLHAHSSHRFQREKYFMLKSRI